MADVKWIKIVTDIFDDEKILLIESMPEADAIIVIWFKLLCLAGKQNNSGVFQINEHIPYTDEMFATIFRRKINTVRLALKTFEEFGMIEIINNTVTIPNWGKHQSIEQMEARREYQRQYHVEYRKKQKLLASGNDGNSQDLRKHLRDDLRDDLRQQTVNTLDKNKIRIDKIREEYDDDERARARARMDTIEAYASNNLQVLSAGNMEQLVAYKEEMADDLIRFAIDEACGNGAPRWAYVRAILDGYKRDGIKTVGDAKAAKEKHRASGGKAVRDNPALNYEQRKTDDDYGKELFVDLDEWGV